MLRPHKFILEKNRLFNKIANFMGKNDILAVIPVQKSLKQVVIPSLFNSNFLFHTQYILRCQKIIHSYRYVMVGGRDKVGRHDVTFLFTKIAAILDFDI